MNTSSEYLPCRPVPEEVDVGRNDPDFLPLNEAIDVAFLAVRVAQQVARDIPASASAAEFRGEWHTSNILVRQALRLVDERVQHLNREIKRLPRLG
jgi:hypothetical protein